MLTAIYNSIRLHMPSTQIDYAIMPSDALKNYAIKKETIMIHLQVHLQIPCYDFLILQMIWFTRLLQKSVVANIFPVRIIHRIIQSIEATGGVYKGQGRNQHKLMTCAY